MVTVEQLSKAPGDGMVTKASHFPGSVGRVMLAGQLTTGASLSATVISTVQVLVFPAASVAVNLTVVVPNG